MSKLCEGTTKLPSYLQEATGPGDPVFSLGCTCLGKPRMESWRVVQDTVQFFTADSSKFAFC